MTAPVRRIGLREVVVGTVLPGRTVRITTADLVRYAGASRDFNPIHFSGRRARELGLPDTIAHGMLTMASAAALVTDWARDPGALIEFRTRFVAPVVVPDDARGATVEVTGLVAAMLDDSRVRVDLSVTSGGARVLGEARAVVLLRP